jgi:Family of unknown function (DUF5330)
MWFLIRTGFWLSLALLALPLSGGNRQAGFADAVLFARAAAIDASGLCQRSPDTCGAGRRLASEVALRAEEAAHIASLYFAAAPERGRQTDAVKTGSVK